MSDDNILTRRESEILGLLAEGLSNDEIANRLTISPNTVKVHVRNIFEKMGVQSRTEATMEAVRRGWIDVPGLEVPPTQPDQPPEWPPLESFWRPWYAVILVAILIVTFTLFLWPSSSPSVITASAPGITTDLDLPQISVPPRQETARWSQRSSMPTARSRAASGIIDDRIIVVGGETLSGDTNVTEVFEPKLDSWQSLPARPVAARGAAGAVLDDELYVLGGCSEQDVLVEVDRLDPQTEIWESVAPLPEPRCGLAAVAFAGRVFAVGGWDGESVTDTLFIYDPETNQWEEGRRLPEKRAFSGAVSIQDLVYVIGGHDGQEHRAEMWTYDPAADTWISAPPLPQPRAGLAAASEGNSIYVFGGGEDGQSHLPERFDLLTQAWSTFDAPHTGTWRHAVTAAIGPNIYVVGGWGGDYLAINEVYKALPYETFLPSVGIDSSD